MCHLLSCHPLDMAVWRRASSQQLCNNEAALVASLISFTARTQRQRLAESPQRHHTTRAHTVHAAPQSLRKTAPWLLVSQEHCQVTQLAPATSRLHASDGHACCSGWRPAAQWTSRHPWQWHVWRSHLIRWQTGAWLTMARTEARASSALAGARNSARR